MKSEISTNNLHEFLTLTKRDPLWKYNTQITHPHDADRKLKLTTLSSFCCIKWAINSGVVQETIVGHVHIHILQVHMYHYTTYSLCA